MTSPNSKLIKSSLPCEAVTLERVYELSFSVAQQILDSSFRPEIIVAIARGGFVPARLLCDFLNVHAMTSISVRHYGAAAAAEARAQLLYPLSANISRKNVLIVDDVNDSGDTLQIAVSHINEFSATNVRTAVLHEKSNSTFRVDFKAESVTEWRWVLYPWARVEDIGTLLQQEYGAISRLSELQARLLEDHGLSVSEEELKRILAIYTQYDIYQSS